MKIGFVLNQSEFQKHNEEKDEAVRALDEELRSLEEENTRIQDALRSLEETENANLATSADLARLLSDNDELVLEITEQKAVIGTGQSTLESNYTLDIIYYRGNPGSAV